MVGLFKSSGFASLAVVVLLAVGLLTGVPVGVIIGVGYAITLFVLFPANPLPTRKKIPKATTRTARMAITFFINQLSSISLKYFPHW